MAEYIVYRTASGPGRRKVYLAVSCQQAGLVTEIPIRDTCPLDSNGTTREVSSSHCTGLVAAHFPGKTGATTSPWMLLCTLQGTISLDSPRHQGLAETKPHVRLRRRIFSVASVKVRCRTRTCASCPTLFPRVAELCSIGLVRR